METIIKISPVAEINRDLLRREIKQQFTAKFKSLSISGYVKDETKFTTGSTVVGRIFVPRTEPFVTTTRITTTGDVVPTDTYAAGEIRITFDPNLTAPQASTLDTLISNHVSTSTTPRQNDRDQDNQDIADIESAYQNDFPYNSMTSLQQNQFMSKLTRAVLRLNNKLDSGE